VVYKNIRGKDIMPGREEAAELPQAVEVSSSTLLGRPH
jgi:hypothetical protein